MTGQRDAAQRDGTTGVDHMARTITRRKALMASTRVDQLPSAPPPPIGDNSAGFVLPPLEAVDDSLRDTLQIIAAGESALEHARQRLAFFIIQRQDVLIARDANVTPLAALFDRSNATLRDPAIAEARRIFAEELLTELCGPFIPHKERTTNEVRDAQDYRDVVSTRLKRGTDLAIAISWRGMTQDDFDHDKGKWRVPPVFFCPPEHTPAMDLLMSPPDDKGARTVREYVWLENDAEDKDNRYFINMPGGQAKRIALSLDQFMFAAETALIAERAKAAGEQAKATAPTKAEQAKADAEARARADLEAKAKAEREAATRAPRTPNPAAKAGDDVAAATEEMAVSMATGDVPEANTDNGKATREHNLAALNKALTMIGTMLAVDAMANLTRQDFTPAAWNGAQDLKLMIDRAERAEAEAARNANGAKRRAA
jgi:Membrane protein involved in colicin uptake